jgi:hypothetical protein
LVNKLGLGTVSIGAEFVSVVPSEQISDLIAKALLGESCSETLVIESESAGEAEKQFLLVADQLSWMS